MTNAELIELLKQDNPNAEVRVERCTGERRWIGVPRNATNGDMIKAMFPNEEIIESDGACVYVGAKMRFDKDWWNAQYKGGENDESNN